MKKLPNWLSLILILVFIARIPSLFAPYYYGDEMIYLTLGNAIRRGMVLYKDIHDNKTPLIYFLAALSGNLFWFHALLCFWVIATVILFWKLTKALFPNKSHIQKMATLVFAIITSLPTLEGQIANAEIFFIGLTIVAFLFALQKNRPRKFIFLSGIFVGLATLFKVPAIFDGGAIIFLFILSLKLEINSFKQKFIQVLLFILGLLAPIVVGFIWYFLRGALHEYVVAAFLQNLGYVASSRTGSVQSEVSLLTKLTPILTRGGFVAVSFILLFFLRKKLSKQYVVATCWLLTSLFAATLSERPYPHYLMQLAPPFAILFGMLLSLEIQEQTLTVIPLALVFGVAVYYKFWYYPTLPYFENMLSITNKDEYQKRFGPEVSVNYKIAKEIMLTTNKDDPVFIWGDSPPLYALSRRLPPIKYIANYHIADYSSVSEITNTLSTKKPRLVVLLPNETLPSVLFSFVKTNYHLIENVEGASFWYNNGT